MKRYARTIASPVGVLRIVGGDRGLAAILWENDRPGRVRLSATEERPDHPVLCETERQLGEYFAARRTVFSVDLDLDGTEFQQCVWAALRTIPFGETRSYGLLARQIGRPGAARAVGAANGRNPVSIIVPCHRVIGADGSPTGFAGGIAAKTFLLDLERGRPGGDCATAR